MYEITCPTCSNVIETPFARIGAVTHCPKCQSKIAVGVKELRRKATFPPEESRNLLLVGSEAANGLAGTGTAPAERPPARRPPPPTTPEDIEAAIEAGLGLDSPDDDEDFVPDLTDETRESPAVTETDFDDDDKTKAAPERSTADAAAPAPTAAPAAAATSAATAPAEKAEAPDDDAEATEDEAEAKKGTYREKVAARNRARRQRGPLLIAGVVFAVLLVAVGIGGYMMFGGGESEQPRVRRIGGLPPGASNPTTSGPTSPNVTPMYNPLVPGDGSGATPPTPEGQTPAVEPAPPPPAAVRPTGLPPQQQRLVDADLPARPAEPVRGSDWSVGYVTAADMELKPSDVVVSDLAWDIESGGITAKVMTTGADPVAYATVRLIEVNKSGRGFAQGTVVLPLLLPGEPVNLRLTMPESRRADVDKVLWEGRTGNVLRNGRSLDDLVWVVYPMGEQMEVRVRGLNNGANSLDRVVLVIRATDQQGYKLQSWTVDWPFPLPPGQAAEFRTTLPKPENLKGIVWEVQAAGRSRSRR